MEVPGDSARQKAYEADWKRQGSNNLWRCELNIFVVPPHCVQKEILIKM